MTPKLVRALGDRVLFAGKLIDVVARTLEVQNDDERFAYTIEVARRPPGVRLIVSRERELLLLKEYRAELGRWDYRLAGGKVFETQHAHLAFLASSTDLAAPLLKAVSEEAHQELGIRVERSEFLCLSRAGATIDWDLYYYAVTGFQEESLGPQAERTELLVAEWHSIDGVLKKILSGEFSEDRSIGILIRHLVSTGLLTIS